MAMARALSPCASGSAETMPAMPHMSGRLHEHGVLERLRRRIAVDEVTKPELQHQQRPQATRVIRPGREMVVPQLAQCGTRHDATPIKTRAEQYLRHEHCQRGSHPRMSRWLTQCGREQTGGKLRHQQAAQRI